MGWPDAYFTPAQSTESLTMMTTMDNINRRFGKGAIFIGKQGIGRTWAMAREMKSPSYTTKVDDFPVIQLQ